ncbi:MAG TPA: hypothetical protein DCW73_06430 [Treponema sp.]|nr:hypothetical protein [Treponema sp.]
MLIFLKKGTNSVSKVIKNRACRQQVTVELSRVPAAACIAPLVPQRLRRSSNLSRKNARMPACYVTDWQ